MELARAFQGDTHHAIFRGIITFVWEPHGNVGEHAPGPHLGNNPTLIVESVVVGVPVPIRPPERTMLVIIVVSQCPGGGVNDLQ